MAKPATFRGCHNWSKTRLLLYLFSNGKAEGYKWFTPRELDGLVPGLRQGYCVGKCQRLAKWNYLKCNPIISTETGRAVMGYSLAERGIKFVQERVPIKVWQDVAAEIQHEYPKLEEILDDLLFSKCELLGIDYDSLGANGAEGEDFTLGTKADDISEDNGANKSVELDRVRTQPKSLPRYICWEEAHHGILQKKAWDWRRVKYPGHSSVSEFPEDSQEFPSNKVHEIVAKWRLQSGISF